MSRNISHWLIEDSDYYEPPENCIEDVYDCNDMLEVYDENTTYGDIIP